MHLAAALENSSLRRISNFFSSCSQVSPWQWVWLFADDELVGTCEDKFVAVDIYFPTILSSSFCSCILFVIFGGCLSSWNSQRRLMLNNWRGLFHSSRVKLPSVKMSASWCLVSMCRVWILESRLITVKQPIRSNSVGSWHASHRWTPPAFDNHLNHGFLVLKDIQHSIGTRMCSVWWNVINVGWIEIGRGWNLFLHVWFSVCRQVSPWPSYIFGVVGLVWWRLKYLKH